jgi:hypothetical protein
MKERLRRRIRLAYEPNRFATEQLIKVYEVLQPLVSRTTTAPSSSNPDRSKRSAAKTKGVSNER